MVLMHLAYMIYFLVPYYFPTVANLWVVISRQEQSNAIPCRWRNYKFQREMKGSKVL